jgi:hypothetical protein
LHAQQRALADQTSNHCRVQDFGRDADNPVCVVIPCRRIACITFQEETICKASNTQTRP